MGVRLVLPVQGLLSFIYDMMSAEDLRMDQNGLRALLTDVHSSRAADESADVVNMKVVDWAETGVGGGRRGGRVVYRFR